MLTLAFKNVLRRKGIAVLALLGIGLGSALILTLLYLSSGLNRQMSETVSAVAGRVVVSPKDALLGGLYFSTGTPLPPVDVAVVRKIPGVTGVYGRVSTSLRPTGDPVLLLPFTGYSQEEIDSARNTPFSMLVEGRAPTNDREVVVGRMLFNTLSFIGQKLTLGGTYAFLMPGSAKTVELKVTGVFQTGDELSDTTVCGFDSLARQVARLPAGDYSSLSVNVVRPDDVEPVQTEISRALADSKPPVQVVVPENLLDPLEASMKAVERFLLAVTLITALGCSLFISIIMSITVLERRKEFAVLKAVGWRGRHITTLVLLESLLLSVAGAMVGLALGYAAAIAASHYLKLGAALPGGLLFGGTTLLAILVGTLGGLYPAAKANRFTPAEIFRQG